MLPYLASRPKCKIVASSVTIKTLTLVGVKILTYNNNCYFDLYLTLLYERILLPIC